MSNQHPKKVLEMVIRALIVDDSALIRKVLSDILNQDPKIAVIGTAINGEIIKADVHLKPGDSITVGDTTLRFTSKDGGSAVPHSEDSAGIDGTSEPAVIDLGFESDTTTNDVKHALKTKKTVMQTKIRKQILQTKQPTKQNK